MKDWKTMLRHQPVLAQETFEHLPQNLHLYFDGTFGHGWHCEYFLTHLPEEQSKELQVIACDIDAEVQKKGLEFTKQRSNHITPVLSSYAHIQNLSEQYGKFDFMLLDLGVNMEHFKDGERGFSIKYDAPLDMRFNRENEVSAETIVNTYPLEKLSDLFSLYGDFSEKTAEYLAKGIIEERKKKKITTTWELKEILYNLKCNQKKIAVIFQALRIETNKELDQLHTFLADFGECLTIWGRCAIMTYHSIEDRIVKLAFKKIEETWLFQLVNKKVIKPTYLEVQKNKAARSAKLRIIEKIK